jgi:hypothetical protein
MLELVAFSWNAVIAFGNPMTPNNIHSKIQCKQRYTCDCLKRTEKEVDINKLIESDI